MEVLERMPFKGRKAVFDRLEQMASKANMTVAERQQYEEEWKNWNDYYNTLDYARKEGLEQGMEEGLAKGMEEGLAKGLEQGRKEGLFSTAQKLKEAGIPKDIIIQTTGLSAEEIEML